MIFLTYNRLPFRISMTLWISTCTKFFSYDGRLMIFTFLIQGSCINATHISSLTNLLLRKFDAPFLWWGFLEWYLCEFPLLPEPEVNLNSLLSAIYWSHGSGCSIGIDSNTFTFPLYLIPLLLPSLTTPCADIQRFSSFPNIISNNKSFKKKGPKNILYISPFYKSLKSENNSEICIDKYYSIAFNEQKKRRRLSKFALFFVSKSGIINILFYTYIDLSIFRYLSIFLSAFVASRTYFFCRICGYVVDFITKYLVTT